MKNQADKVIEQAIRLSEADRIRLAERVLATLDGGPDLAAGTAWAAEIAQRTQAIEQGLVQPVPWSEVKRVATRTARERR